MFSKFSFHVNNDEQTIYHVLTPRTTKHGRISLPLLNQLEREACDRDEGGFAGSNLHGLIWTAGIIMNGLIKQLQFIVNPTRLTQVPLRCYEIEVNVLPELT